MMVMLEMEDSVRFSRLLTTPIDSREGAGRRCVFRPGTGTFPNSRTQEKAGLGSLARVPTANTSRHINQASCARIEAGKGVVPAAAIRIAPAGLPAAARTAHELMGLLGAPACPEQAAAVRAPRLHANHWTLLCSGLRDTRAAGTTLTMKEKFKID